MKFTLKLRNTTTKQEKKGLLESARFDHKHFIALAQKKGFELIEVFDEKDTKIWPPSDQKETANVIQPSKLSVQSRFFENLNEQQAQAVRKTQGFVRIIAGAGSGKTKVLANRYAYIVEELGISTSNILCVTFTNRAANEMKSRIQGLLQREPVNDYICTYHGFCAKLLREEIFRLQYPLSFVIIDESDQGDILKEVYEKLHISSRDYTYKHARKIIHYYKSNFPYISEYILPANAMEAREEMSIKDRLFLEYVKIQKRLFALDFDDLILFALYVLGKFPDARDKWQRKLCYIMVDETQDNSIRQWILVDLLCGKHKNLFIVGDPDQCIYEWRGADPKHLIDFDKTHIPCTTIILDSNYRSSQKILNVANSIIDHNQKRIPKNLIAKRDRQTKITHIHAKDDMQEAHAVVQIIEQRKGLGAKFSHFAILYRASSVSRAFEQALIQAKIPYVVYGGIRFFERKEIKDALAYLRLISNGDDLSLLRVINTPSRRLGKVFISTIKEIANSEGKTFFNTLKDHINDPEISKPGAIEFVNLIEDARIRSKDESISQTLQGILDRSGLMDDIRKDGETDRLDNIKELMLSIRQFEAANKNEPSYELHQYL